MIYWLDLLSHSFLFSIGSCACLCLLVVVNLTYWRSGWDWVSGCTPALWAAWWTERGIASVWSARSGQHWWDVLYETHTILRSLVTVDKVAWFSDSKLANGLKLTFWRIILAALKDFCLQSAHQPSPKFPPAKITHTVVTTVDAVLSHWSTFWACFDTSLCPPCSCTSMKFYTSRQDNSHCLWSKKELSQVSKSLTKVLNLIREC